MDLSNWLKTPCIDIDFRENYGKKLLHAPNGRRPRFWLEPKKLCNPHGEDQVVQFRAHYPAGCMMHNWAELLFTPLGTQPVPPLPQKLPKWSPDKEPEYAAGLDRLIAELYRDDTKTERLEAYLPLFLDQSEQSKRDDRRRKDRDEDGSPGETLLVAEAASGEETPVLGRQNVDNVRMIETLVRPSRFGSVPRSIGVHGSSRCAAMFSRKTVVSADSCRIAAHAPHASNDQQVGEGGPEISTHDEPCH